VIIPITAPRGAKGPFGGFEADICRKLFGRKEAGNAALVGWSPVMRHFTQSNHRAKLSGPKIV
jgi:hypothetical protein